MSGKIKNRKGSLKDFLRYRRDEMTGEERNSFERELQKDPFLTEAGEGFDAFPDTEVTEDLSRLHKRLKNRTIQKTRFIYYRIAASVAVLMVITTVFIVTQRNDQVSTLSEKIEKEEMVSESTPAEKPIPSPAEKAADKKEDIVIPPARKAKTGKQPEIIKIEEKGVAGVQVAEARDQVAEAQDKAEETEVQDAGAGVRVAEAQPEIQDSEGAKDDFASVQGKVSEEKSIVSEKKMDMARAAGAPANYKSAALRDYNPPQPVIGKDSFDIYLAKNIRIPESKGGEQRVVVVSFKVSVDSTVKNIKVINTPGQLYSREAIRLIKDGPKWIPGNENGIIMEDEVKLTILFNKN